MREHLDLDWCFGSTEGVPACDVSGAHNRGSAGGSAAVKRAGAGRRASKHAGCWRARPLSGGALVLPSRGSRRPGQQRIDSNVGLPWESENI